MFKNVNKIEYDKVETEDHIFPVKQILRKIKYIDYENNLIETSPYISFESEESG